MHEESGHDCQGSSLHRCPYVHRISNYEGLARLAIIEAIKAGTTTFGDYETNVDSVCEFIYKVGVRGNIAYTIREAVKRVYNPGELYEFDENLGEQSFNENVNLYNKWHNKDNGRIKILFGPHGKILTIDEKKYIEEVNRHTKGIGERASKEFFEINGSNAAFMREDK